ncbi:hypothetical protein M5D96_012925 [Drosophila gunungcola]|uniref:Uncharacterized protein n=1 Tax=Drosophila gunungcola TaxID=103775 RepID=A0A9P9YD08_9MUSC|nr:hypothetical protein M5D96_012925 [Drosophila gunungcola]
MVAQHRCFSTYDCGQETHVNCCMYLCMLREVSIVWDHLKTKFNYCGISIKTTGRTKSFLPYTIPLPHVCTSKSPK